MGGHICSSRNIFVWSMSVALCGRHIQYLNANVPCPYHASSNTSDDIVSPCRLLHSSSLVVISDFSVGYGTWPPIGWCYRMCDWLKWISTGVYLQGAEFWLLHPWLMFPMAISTVSPEGLWEYPGLAQMGLPLGLCKVICSIVYVQRREWMDPMSPVKIAIDDQSCIANGILRSPRWAMW